MSLLPTERNNWIDPGRPASRDDRAARPTTARTGWIGIDAMPAYFADFLRDPDERVVVFFATNRAAPPIRSVAHSVARIVFDSTFVARLAPAPLITERYAPDFLAMVPVDRHLEVLGRMQTELRGFRLTLTGPSGIKHLQIGVAAGDDPKVAGLGGEDQ